MSEFWEKVIRLGQILTGLAVLAYAYTHHDGNSQLDTLYQWFEAYLPWGIAFGPLLWWVGSYFFKKTNQQEIKNHLLEERIKTLEARETKGVLVDSVEPTGALADPDLRDPLD